MREGIHRDGRHLYPAFPYTHFAKTTDADLQALYAYPDGAGAGARRQSPQPRLPFRSIGVRCWRDGTRCSISPALSKPDAAQSAAWNRGAYLVEGLGHCGACHSPRNALGAEKTKAYLAGGFAEGWEAPPLTSLSHAPIPWSEDELFAYLRTGESRFHGVAAGPMAPVVKELAALPDEDIRAMAVYLASFQETRPRQTDAGRAGGRSSKPRPARGSPPPPPVGARLYEGRLRGLPRRSAAPPLFGSRPSLALNSNLHGAAPDNLIQVILHGIASPASSDLGYMPAFKDSLTDDQLAELVSYLRQQFAPDKPPWADVREAVSRVRQTSPSGIAWPNPISRSTCAKPEDCVAALLYRSTQWPRPSGKAPSVSLPLWGVPLVYPCGPKSGH